jgi:hypothetical protein
MIEYSDLRTINNGLSIFYILLSCRCSLCELSAQAESRIIKNNTVCHSFQAYHDNNIGVISLSTQDGFVASLYSG